MESKLTRVNPWGATSNKYNRLFFQWRSLWAHCFVSFYIRYFVSFSLSMHCKHLCHWFCSNISPFYLGIIKHSFNNFLFGIKMLFKFAIIINVEIFITFYKKMVVYWEATEKVFLYGSWQPYCPQFCLLFKIVTTMGYQCKQKTWIARMVAILNH